MSQSMEIASLQQTQGNKFIKNSNFKLPQLQEKMQASKMPQFGKRFNSVKTRDYLNRTKREEESSQPSRLEMPTSFRSISEALPMALIKKK